MKFNRKNVRKALEEMERCGVNASSTSLDAEIVSSTCARLIAALCPDKSAPKVYTEDELEPVGTVPVVGDRYVVAYVPSGQDAYKVGQLFTAKSTTVEGVDSWSHFCFDHRGSEKVMRFRILKRPLRCVFKDPRVGDVVRNAGHGGRSTAIEAVTERNVITENDAGVVITYPISEFARLSGNVNWEVISRAESK